MKGKIQKIDGIFPVSVIDAIYVGDGTTDTLSSYLDKYYLQVITPEQYGAVADGVTDCTDAIRSAIQEAGKTKGTVRLSKGIYKVTDRIIIDKEICFEGSGTDDTVVDVSSIQYHTETPFDPTYGEEMNSAIVLKKSYIRLTNFTLQGVNASNVASSCNGICMHYGEGSSYAMTFYHELSFLHIRGFKIGVFLYGGWDRYIHNLKLSYCTESGISYKVLDNREYWTNSGDLIEFIYMSGCGDGVHAEFSFETTFKNIVVEDSTRFCYVNFSNNIVFDNCWNEENSLNPKIKGSARILGGRGFTYNNVDHEYINNSHNLFFQKEADIIISRGGQTYYELINGVIVKGGSSVQSDWNESDNTKLSYIKNKPSVYSKPSSGIPKTDLDNSVQASLDKADTALQFADINKKMDTINPTGTGSFSLNRKANTVIGDYSHAEGVDTTASGKYSHSEGVNTTAYNKSQHVQGEYNIIDETESHGTRGTYAHIVGNGKSESERSNAHTLDWNGNAWYSGDVTSTDSNGNSHNLNDTYVKPSGGIPKTDLDSTVQTTLNNCLSMNDIYTDTNVDVIVVFSVKNTSGFYYSNSFYCPKSNQSIRINSARIMGVDTDVANSLIVSHSGNYVFFYTSNSIFSEKVVVANITID